jgi:TrmH family RNA methyltransferase
MNNVRVITSPSNEEIKSIRALHDKKERRATGLFMVEGLRSVMSGVAAGFDLHRVVYLADMKHHKDVLIAIQHAQKSSGYGLEVTLPILEKISTRANAQFVIGVFKQKLHQLEDLKVNAETFLVGLDTIRDPGNLGTIIRTLDAAAASGVILIDQSCDPFAPDCVNATMDSIFHIPIISAKTSEFSLWVKTFKSQHKGHVLGTALDGAIDYRDAQKNRPLVILMGSEQSGLSPELRSLSDQLVKIPMLGRAESLNVAVATGILVYEFKN